jgi:hypothetical protein
LKWLTGSPWWAIVTFVVFVLLALWGIYVTVIGVRKKRLRYAVRTNNLIRDVINTKMPGVAMTFANYHTPIENFSVTRLALWNAGNDGISTKNIKQPLRIQMSGTGNVILGVGIIAHNRPNKINRFECTLAADRMSAAIGFDFIDHNHGIVVQIAHTALSSRSFSVEGYIEGMGEPQQRYMVAGADRSVSMPTSPADKRRRPLSKRTARILFGWLLIVFVFVLCSAPFIPWGESSRSIPEPVIMPRWFALLFVIGLSSPLAIWAYFLLRPGVPKELRVFEEDF